MKLLTNEEIDNATVYEMKVLREQAKLANRPADPQPSAREAALEEALKNADQFLLAVSIAHTDYVKNWTLHMTEAGTNLKRSIEALRSNAPGKGEGNA